MTPGTPPSTDGPAKSLTIVRDPYGGPKRPHDARLNGDVLTMLDNQAATGRTPRAVAYRIDEAAGTATMLWEFRNAAPGGATLGSTQQTADSVVINWGAGQQPFQLPTGIAFVHRVQCRRPLRQARRCG